MPDSSSPKAVSAATISVWGGEEVSLMQGATQVPIAYVQPAGG